MTTKPIKQFVSELIRNSAGLLSHVSPPTKGFKGRKDEVDAVSECLMKKRMRNCVIVGDAGVGKSEIAKAAIKRFPKEEGIFLNFDIGFVQSGCTLIGQFEERMKNIFSSICSFNKVSDEKVFVFIDEIHNLWRVNKNEYLGTICAGDMLKPFLAEGALTIVGTTTNDEYRQYVVSDKALLRRLPPVFVTALEDDTVKAILTEFAGKDLSADVIDEILERSHEVPYLHNPDCALEIADRVMAKALVNGRTATKDDVDCVLRMMGAIE